MTHSRFDSDPEALAWARAKVQAYIDRLADFERQATEKQDQITAHGCGVSRLLAERHFLGDGGCTIGVFDERLPGLTGQLTVNITVVPDSPAVQEEIRRIRREGPGGLR